MQFLQKIATFIGDTASCDSPVDHGLPGRLIIRLTQSIIAGAVGLSFTRLSHVAEKTLRQVATARL